MAESTTFLKLPTEVHALVAECLDLPSRMQLRKVCRYFLELIPQLSIHEMLKVEVSAFGIQKDLYTCGDCLRLRPRAKFADNMVKKKKARFAINAEKRFCVECGINPGKGTTRYTRGSLIVVQGESFALCRSCGSFSEAAVEGGRNICECKRCRLFSRAIEQRAEEYRARQERARLRAEQALQRTRRREIWGSEYEYSEDDISTSPTWSDIQMEMIQSEADTYMNSPKPGSE